MDAAIHECSCFSPLLCRCARAILLSPATPKNRSKVHVHVDFFQEDDALVTAAYWNIFTVIGNGVAIYLNYTKSF